ncbi:MAG TPA: aldo/keto reductase [Candidatus Acidoferrum sp.]|jgi:aryl-alcohol dehydrogenase-like predicted oxidoreductase|nr:aldo/keto reductase [Candidatus Acidoferrum sp.]
MKFVEVGGVRLSAIGLGTWQFGSTEWGYGKDYASGQAGAIVKRALELGVNLIDTAEVYGLGRSEKIVGEAIRGRREEVFLATKLFPIGLPFMVGGRARASAKRLAVDRLDLYQLHWPGPLFPPGSTMPRMKRLVDSGLVTHVGVSNHSLAQWQRAEGAFDGPILSNQVSFSLIARAPERELLPWAQREGRLIIAYSPLGQGLLSGKYQKAPPRNFRRGRRAFSASSRSRLQPLVDALSEIGAEHGATNSQVALAWLIRKPNVVAIPGASNLRQLEENVAAADVELSDDDDARLTALSLSAE